MCESLKPELDLLGVKMTLINPGFVETPLTDKNEFPMPFLIPVEEAVDVIIKGLQKPNFEISFPRGFSLIMKVLSLLPAKFYFALTKRLI